MATVNGEPLCSECKATSSPIWRRSNEGHVLCIDCHTVSKKRETQEKASSEPVSTPPPVTTRKRRGGKKTTRGDKNRAGSVNAQPYNGNNHFKGRRSLMKGKPVKAPHSEPNILTSDSVLYKGIVYEVGDVVSLLDYSGGIYYAIIRGFLVDQYADKYAMLKWLLPRSANPSYFDPANFIFGPDEDEPRKLEILDFVCHSPNSKSFCNSFQHEYDTASLWVTQR